MKNTLTKFGAGISNVSVWKKNLKHIKDFVIKWFSRTVYSMWVKLTRRVRKGSLLGLVAMFQGKFKSPLMNF